MESADPMAGTAPTVKVPRRGAMNIYMTVRGFYTDLLQLAYDDPARWALWPCRPPVTQNEVKRYKKWKRAPQRDARAHPQPGGPSTSSPTPQNATTTTPAPSTTPPRPPGKMNASPSMASRYNRVDGATHMLAHPTSSDVLPDGTLTPNGDLVLEEEDAFWGVVIVEVLRHTGMRIEEMLELTQLDVHEYDHRDPNVGKVLLLHVNPSKQDQERMLVIAPELAAVLASVARRIRHAVGSTEPALPSVVLYDYCECKNSEPLPFFFQRTAGRGFKGTTRPITRGYVARVLRLVCASADLVGSDGSAIDFTSHDFRRVFATDALSAGLPPHIIQKLLGHASMSDDARLRSDLPRRRHTLPPSLHREPAQDPTSRRIPRSDHPGMGPIRGALRETQNRHRRLHARIWNQLRPRIRLRTMQTSQTRPRRRTAPHTNPPRTNRTIRRGHPPRLDR